MKINTKKLFLALMISCILILANSAFATTQEIEREEVKKAPTPGQAEISVCGKIDPQVVTGVRCLEAIASVPNAVMCKNPPGGTAVVDGCSVKDEGTDAISYCEGKDAAGNTFNGRWCVCTYSCSQTATGPSEH